MMADHGVNRRRSHYARKRQREGKQKAARSLAIRKSWLAYWRDFWSRPLGEK